MAPRIFYLGATGYVGGHTLNLLVAEHPEYQIVALVRNDEQAGKLKAAFPSIETTTGDLDSGDVLIREASNADIVINAASSDHSPGAKALVLGLRQGRRGNLIHVSGTGILHDVSNGYGNESPKIYHDNSKADIDEIISFDATHLHQDTEKVIRTTAKEGAVTFAIICPPTIYGIGNGPIKRRSAQIPFLSEAILKRGRAFQVLEGQNIWDSGALLSFRHVHVDDVASALVLLTEEAVKGDKSKVGWGDESYYFLGTAEHKWGTVCSSIAKILHAKGKLLTAEVDKLSIEEVLQLHPWGPVLWAGNSRSRAERIRELGWVPRGADLAASLEQLVDVEIEAFEAGEAK